VVGPTVQAATESANPQTGVRANLPTTGSDVGLNVLLGVFLIGLGLALVSAPTVESS
jgi:hypothetical protein